MEVENQEGQGRLWTVVPLMMMMMMMNSLNRRNNVNALYLQLCCTINSRYARNK
jgi:hypothetical protein